MGEIRVYDSQSLLLLKSFQAHASSIFDLKQSPFNSDLVATTSSFFEPCKIWNQKTGWNLIRTFGSWSWLFEFLSEYLIAVVPFGSSQIDVWSLNTGLLTTTINAADSITSLSYDGILLFVGFSNGNIKVYNDKAFYLYDSYQIHTSAVTVLEKIFNQAYVASVSNDQTIGMWTWQADAPNQFKLNVKKRDFTCLKQINTNILAVGSSSGLIELINFNDNDNGFSNVIKNLTGHQSNSQIASLGLLNDGQLLVSAATDGQIKIWEWSSGKCLSTIDTKVAVYSLAVLKTNPPPITTATTKQIFTTTNTKTTTKLITTITPSKFPTTTIFKKKTNSNKFFPG